MCAQAVKPIKLQRKFERNVHKYCASIWIGSSCKGISTRNPEAGFSSISLHSRIPKKIRNGTLTFVKTDGRYFGITCKHLINLYNKMNENYIKELCNKYPDSKEAHIKSGYKAYGLFTQNDIEIDLSEHEFKQVLPQWPDNIPDVVITKLDEKTVFSLKKRAVDLDKDEEIPDDLYFGVAVGYPENLKYRKDLGNNETAISMPVCVAASYINEVPSGSFTLCGKSDKEVERNFSGMSGGPIFWNHRCRHNIMGIIYESPNQQYKVFDNRHVVVSGELATPKRIKDWIRELYD